MSTTKISITVIAISAPSACGKTTLAEGLCQALGSARTRLFSQDDYYDDDKIAALPRHERFGPDFESPHGIDHERLWADVMRAANGKGNKQLDEKDDDDNGVDVDDDSLRFVIVEGFLLFWHEASRGVAHVRIFLDASSDEDAAVLCERRVAREITAYCKLEFAGEQVAAYRDFYMQRVWPEYLKHRERQLANAEIQVGKQRPLLFFNPIGMPPEAVLHRVLDFVMLK